MTMALSLASLEVEQGNHIIIPVSYLWLGMVVGGEKMKPTVDIFLHKLAPERFRRVIPGTAVCSQVQDEDKQVW